jgi:hypothetical protein
MLRPDPCPATKDLPPAKAPYLWRVFLSAVAGIRDNLRATYWISFFLN